jgi:hypothetical protein
MNCSAHPTRNSASGSGQRPSTKIAATNNGSERAIIGIPKV